MTALSRLHSAAAGDRGPVPGARRWRSVRRGSAAIGTAALGTAFAAALASPALAATAHPSHEQFGFGGANDRAVFVQTDNTTGNAVVAYRRSPSGALTEADSHQTGGLGGQLTGSVVDHLASQGSLALDRAAGLLVALNAGSTATPSTSSG